MKKQKFSKKLNLNKETISNLKMKEVKGGKNTVLCYTADGVCITLADC